MQQVWSKMQASMKASNVTMFQKCKHLDRFFIIVLLLSAAVAVVLIVIVIVY